MHAAGSGSAPACRRCSAACGSPRPTPCSAPSWPSSAAAARFGLGVYLLGSLGRADPARLWGIGLAATAIAGLAYALFAPARPRASPGRAARSPSPPARCPTAAAATLRRDGWRLGVACARAAVPASGGCCLVAGDRRRSSPRPRSACSTTCSCGADGRARRRGCSRRSAQTLPITLLGMAAGLARRASPRRARRGQAGDRRARCCRSRW